MNRFPTVGFEIPESHLFPPEGQAIHGVSRAFEIHCIAHFETTLRATAPTKIMLQIKSSNKPTKPIRFVIDDSYRFRGGFRQWFGETSLETIAGIQ